MNRAISRGREPMPRFAVKVLFQFRVTVGRRSNHRRVCEERIVVISARSAKGALAAARRQAAREEFSYRDGVALVHFEFVGVLDLVELVSGGHEVWFRLHERVTPMERRARILPPERRLLNESTPGSHKLKVPGRAIARS